MNLGSEDSSRNAYPENVTLVLDFLSRLANLTVQSAETEIDFTSQQSINAIALSRHLPSLRLTEVLDLPSQATVATNSAAVADTLAILRAFFDPLSNDIH